VRTEHTSIHQRIDDRSGQRLFGFDPRLVVADEWLPGADASK
jgi:hypothetical protein